MAEERRCGQCGKGLPADAPGGLCPECLLKVGLQSQSQEPPDQGAEGVLPTESYGRKADGAAKRKARDVDRAGSRANSSAGIESSADWAPEGWAPSTRPTIWRADAGWR